MSVIDEAARLGHSKFLVAYANMIKEKRGGTTNLEKLVNDMLAYGKILKIRDSSSQFPFTLVQYAAFIGNKELLEWMVSHFPITLRNSFPSPLQYAILKGHTDCAKAIFNIKTNYKFVVNRWNGIPALHIASYSGNQEIVKTILETKEGSDDLIGLDYPHHPLNLAAFEGHKGVVKLLLEYHYQRHFGHTHSSLSQTASYKSAVMNTYDKFPLFLVERVTALGQRAKADGAPNLMLMALKEQDTSLAKTLLTLLYSIPCSLSKSYYYTPTMSSAFSSAPPLFVLSPPLVIHGDPWLSVSSIGKWVKQTTGLVDHYPEQIVEEEDRKEDKDKAVVEWDIGLQADYFSPNSGIEYALTNMIAYHGNVELATLSGREFYACDAYIVGMRGHFGMYKAIIAKNPSLATDFLNGACVSGRLEIVRKCLKLKIPIGSALYKAACSGQLEVVRLLLDNGAMVNELHNYEGAYEDKMVCQQQTTLHGVVQNGHVEVVEELIKRGADLNMKYKYELNDYYDWGCTDTPSVIPLTPIHLALSKGHFEVARLLINEGAEIETGDKEKHCKSLYFALKHNNVNMARFLVARWPYCSEAYLRILGLAAYRGNFKFAKLMLQKLKKVAKYNNILDLSAPIHVAVIGGHLKIIKLLVKNAAVWNLPTHYNFFKSIELSLGHIRGDDILGTAVSYHGSKGKYCQVFFLFYLILFHLVLFSFNSFFFL